MIELNNGNKERRYLYISNDMIKELFKFYDSSKKISIIEEDNIHSGDGIINYINNISKLMANDIDCAIEIGYMEYYDRKPSEAEKSKIKNDLIERMNKVEDKGI